MLQTPPAFIPLITPAMAAAPLRRVFLFHQGQLLLRSADLALPEQLDALGLSPEQLHPVGLWQDCYYQVAWTDNPALPDAEHGWHGLRALFGSMDEGLLGLASRASQLAEWARTHRFCGACARPMARAAGERSFQCPACGMTAYPRISPAMMVLIRKGESALLAVHAQAPYKRFTALAGFLEAGESIEEAVHREVYEEVGLRVQNLRYFGSQSWPFPHSLMIAFTADYLDGEIRVDPNEISEARWFGPGDEWPEMSATVSIAAALINAHRPR
ncbi:NAD(+) diphosphatase [Massilia sp. YIM B04103]|uniref:NAD(+) diphosphatase n=1 Tax=Massilia sp. YIM B04103 TaxID=2963106 RepID=UPI00210AA37D|nr:NAD(+) diphosphatase [Massilia sp. YIM B04103]